jgi:hypothetical protein
MRNHDYGMIARVIREKYELYTAASNVGMDGVNFAVLALEELTYTLARELAAASCRGSNNDKFDFSKFVIASTGKAL